MDSRGRTIKLHKMVHLTDTIRRFGNLKHVNAQFFEGDHKNTKNQYGCVLSALRSGVGSGTCLSAEGMREQAGCGPADGRHRSAQ